MPIIIGRSGVQGDILYELARTERLVADLELIAHGGLPTESALATAPILHHWKEAMRPAPCLVGVCGDHPSLNGPAIVTSDVWMFAPELGWARTLSRFYRLGAPFSGRNKP